MSIPSLSLFLISSHPFSTLLLFNVTSHYFRPIMLPLPHYLPEAQKGRWGRIPLKTQGGMTPASLTFPLLLCTLLNCLLFLRFWAVRPHSVCTLMTGVECTCSLSIETAYIQTAMPVKSLTIPSCDMPPKLKSLLRLSHK